MSKKSSRKKHGKKNVNHFEDYDDFTDDEFDPYREKKQKKENNKWWLILLLILLVFLVGVGLFLIAFFRQANWHEHSGRKRIMIVTPTCEEGGYSVYECDCGAFIHCDFTEKLGHQYERKEISVTCETDGYVQDICKNCNLTILISETKATGHTWEQTVLAEATCLNEGKTLYTCSVCSQTSEKEIPPTGHDWQSTVRVEATCEKSGVMGKQCSICSTTEEEEIPATGHNWKTTSNTATCLQQGKESRDCLVCGKTEYEKYVPPLGHDPKTQVRKERGCSTPGEQITVCNRCGEVLSLDPIEPIGSHDYQNNKCTRCGVDEYVNGFKFALTGSYPDYAYTAVEYVGSSTNVTMPDEYDSLPVTALSGNALRGNQTMENVKLSENLTSLGDSAFQDCTYLRSVTMSEGITVLPEALFFNCKNLSSFTIPSTVVKIGKSCFLSCTSLTEITVPNGVTALAMNTFNACSKLATVNLPANLKTIGEDCFYGCESLGAITLPESLVYISSDAFRNSALLTIRFNGTPAAWAEIEKGSDAFPSSATVVFIQ